MVSDKKIIDSLKIDKATLDMFKRVQKQAMEEVSTLSWPHKGKIKVLGISGSARDSSDMAGESSNSEELLKTCLKQCKALGADTDMIVLRDQRIEHCKACYSTVNTQCHFPCSCYPKGTPLADDMSDHIYDKIIAADAIIFATPVNNFKISTPMSAFIDRCISLDGSLSPANPKDPKNKDMNIKHMKFIELTADNEVPGSGFIRRFSGKVAGIIITGHEEGASMAISSLFMTLNHFGMLFPPFSNMYVMSSVCNPTYADKDIVLSSCYGTEVKLLAENIMKATKIAGQERSWRNDCRSD